MIHTSLKSTRLIKTQQQGTFSCLLAPDQSDTYLSGKRSALLEAVVSSILLLLYYFIVQLSVVVDHEVAQIKSGFPPEYR